MGYIWDGFDASSYITLTYFKQASVNRIITECTDKIEYVSGFLV